MKLCYLTLTNSSLSLCLHVLYNSLRLLRVAPSGENMIRYFSFKHSWQVLVTGLKTLPLAKIFHDISYGTPSLFSSQMYLLRVVALFPSFSCLKSYMCLLYLILNVPTLSPYMFLVANYQESWPTAPSCGVPVIREVLPD